MDNILHHGGKQHNKELEKPKKLELSSPEDTIMENQESIKGNVSPINRRLRSNAKATPTGNSKAKATPKQASENKPSINKRARLNSKSSAKSPSKDKKSQKSKAKSCSSINSSRASRKDKKKEE